MESIEIVYLLIGILFVLNILLILFLCKFGCHSMDDSDLYNEDGDHIYYDRKLIQYKKKMKLKQIKKWQKI